MDTMRNRVLWVGGLCACVLAVAIGVQTADSAPVKVKVKSASSENVDILVSDMRPGQLFRLPEVYTVKKRYPDGHPMRNALAGVSQGCNGVDVEIKEIYTSKRGQFGYRPGRGKRIADDLVTELVRECSICSLEVRVTGGVEDGDGEFRADIELYDGCPLEGGTSIPDSLVQYTGLVVDLGQFHDLVLDYSDRGMCNDGVCPSGDACQVALQDCMYGICGDGTACDPNEEPCSDGSPCTDGTCEDETPCTPVCADGTQCTAHAAGLCADDSACDAEKQACLDGSKCRNGTCSDGALCEPNRPPCADGTLCDEDELCGDGSDCPPLICEDGSTCVKSECVGDPCSVSQQNCSAGICTDGSACDLADPNCEDKSECQPTFILCVEDPLQIPPTVWIRLRFDTEQAAVVMGETPTRGFSADAYDDLHGHCTAWFAGWPTFPHATFYAEILAPVECETHFLAYLAANPNKPAFLPSDIGGVILPLGGTRPAFTNPTTRLGDDINLTVDSCILSAYELGMKGTAGAFLMNIDIRWPNLTDGNPNTPDGEDPNIRHAETFSGRGDGAAGGSAEVSHFTIDEDVNLSINTNDQPIFITWSSNRTNTGAMEVNINQAGTSGPDLFAYDVDLLQRNRWVAVTDGDNTPAVFYAAIFCRGEAPRGACCPNQPDQPGRDMECFDGGLDEKTQEIIGVPVTSCLGTRWQIDSTCAENTFEPPCGTHSCCGTNSNCNHRTRDDCLEDCITDVDPIFCEPVCVGGPNFGQPCSGDGDCEPEGICDDNAQCPGQRTCGVTGCQVNGEFTGRACDLNNPDQGNSDCMKCSTSGDYCRPRCTEGIRGGRPCDDNGDCPDSVCDNGFDCPDEETCDAGHVCVHEAGLCSLRCARWGAGKFCGIGDQFCPNFTCFDAVGDCADVEPEHVCHWRCSLTHRSCTFDANCSGSGYGTCDNPTGGQDAGRCTGKICQFNNDCDTGQGVCAEDNRDCPQGTHCLIDFRVCTGREGCDHLGCCGVVCGIRPACCDGSQGETWDNSCVSTADDHCEFPPGNDECFSTRANEGAFEFILEDDDDGGACTSGSDRCSGSKRANNDFATSRLDDPGFCCNKRGAGAGGAGTIWYKFEAMHGSARIHNCPTPGSSRTINSLIQVFKAVDQTNDGNDLDECNSLEVIACNDDAGICGGSGENCPDGNCLASVCVVDLTVGDTYYIMMAASTGSAQGRYDIDIQSPCPSAQAPPIGSICEFAQNQGLPDDPNGVPFDLANASLDCPPEPLLPGMTNDTWFLAQSTCAGNMIIQTCGYDLGEENPATTLAVYRTDLSFQCPPTNLVGWNDDATISPACTIRGDVCDAHEDCKLGCQGTGMQCDSDADCPGLSACVDSRRAVCETVPGKCEDGSVCDPDEDSCSQGSCKVGRGESSLTACIRAFCTSDSECPEDTACTNGICDSDESLCIRGVCEHDLNTECDATMFGSCANGDPCDGITDCVDGSVCEPECGRNGNENNRPWECFGQEACVLAECVSECAPSSYVVVPTFANQWYFVRVGGVSGGEPSGTIRHSCVPDDCNSNSVPDGIEIGLNPGLDCNQNARLDSCELDAGEINDCNCNNVPDECEMDEGNPIDCAPFVAAGEPCEEGPFFCPSFGCEFDVNNNGIPDCCDAGVPPAVCPVCPVVCGITDLTGIVFADANAIAPLAVDQPVHCAIDARQPHDINDATAREGWDRMVLSFTCDPAAFGLAAGDFTVTAGTPGISSVVINGPANTATVMLNDKITPGDWTCIEHTPSGNHWCMGYLPADASGDGLSAASDINALINAINLVPGFGRPIYATDMDRSGVTLGSDILRLIDLLNGAGAFDQWITQGLPVCP